MGDTFDALTTNRPYQKAYDPVEALRIIENLSGKRLDPRAVTALMAVFYRGDIRIPKAIVPGTPAAPAEKAPPIHVSPALPDSLTVETTRT